MQVRKLWTVDLFLECSLGWERKAIRYKMNKLLTLAVIILCLFLVFPSCLIGSWMKNIPEICFCVHVVYFVVIKGPHVRSFGVKYHNLYWISGLSFKILLRNCRNTVTWNFLKSWKLLLWVFDNNFSPAKLLRYNFCAVF